MTWRAGWTPVHLIPNQPTGHPAFPGGLFCTSRNIVAILDSNDTAVVQYKYDARGRIISKTGSLASTLGTVQPFRYRGYVFDEETELYYLRSRYYHSSILRFLNSDRQLSGHSGFLGINMYAYCINTPIRCLDFSGTECSECEKYGYTCYDIYQLGKVELQILMYQMDIMYPDEEPALPIDQAMENILGVSYDELVGATVDEIDYILTDADGINNHYVASMLVFNTINGLFEPFVEYSNKSGVYITNLIGRQNTICGPVNVSFTLSYSQWYDELGIEFFSGSGSVIKSICKRTDREVIDFIGSVLQHNGCVPTHHHFTSYFETCPDVMHK